MSKTITVGGLVACFVAVLLAASQAQIGPKPGGGGGTPGGSNTQVQFNDSGAFNGDSNIVINKTNHTLGIGGVTSSFGGIGTNAQSLSTNRLPVRLADDSGWAVVATGGFDIMSGSNRNGLADSGGSGIRFMTDVGTGIDFVATASGGSGANGIHFSGAMNDVNHSVQVPSTGFTITLANNIWHTILDPAGTLATGTITLPALPGDGMIINVRTSQIITGLTVNPNAAQSVKGNPTTLAVGGIFECIYNAGNTTWYC